MAYSQNDPAWKNLKLGFGPGTIGPYGCFLTAFSNVLKWAGKDLNPAQLNEVMKSNKWFSGDMVTQHQVPNLVAPDKLEWIGRTAWTGPTPMDFFKDASDPNVVYIICIDAKPMQAGVQTHFMMVWAKSGANDLIVEDSWDGVRKKLSAYGSPSAIIQTAYKWRKKAPAAPAPVTPAPKPVDPTVALKEEIARLQQAAQDQQRENDSLTAELKAAQVRIAELEKKPVEAPVDQEKVVTSWFSDLLQRIYKWLFKKG